MTNSGNASDQGELSCPTKGYSFEFWTGLGGRFFLGKAATLYFRRYAGENVEIIYRMGMWTRHVNSDFFPDSSSFDYSFQDFAFWKQQMAQYVADTNEYWLYQYRPSPGEVIIDVGAGRGEDALTFSRAVGKNGRVIAIEAHPVSFAILQNFCRLNGLTNVIPLHVAVMDKPGAVRIVESESSLARECSRADEWKVRPFGSSADIGRHIGGVRGGRNLVSQNEY